MTGPSLQPQPHTQALWDELRRFIRPARLIDGAAALEPALAVPAAWSALLEAQRQGRKSGLHARWSTFAAQLPNVATFLHRQCGPVVVLAEQSGAVSLLYPFTSDAAGIGFYRGHPPLARVPDKFQALWPRIPLDLRDFYTQVHDGWTYLPANSMGPLPVEDWAFLSEDRFDIDDAMAAGMPVDISKVFTVFHNGGGDYLCLDCSRPDGAATGLIWWHEDPAHPEAVDFWAVLDAWIGIFLEDAR